MTIVGVVADTRRTGYDAPVRPETYLPHAQSPDSGLMLVVRTQGDPAAFLPSLRAIVREIDPGIAVQGGRALEAVLVEMTAQRRLNTLLLSVFGICRRAAGGRRHLRRHRVLGRSSARAS